MPVTLLRDVSAFDTKLSAICRTVAILSGLSPRLINEWLPLQVERCLIFRLLPPMRVFHEPVMSSRC